MRITAVAKSNFLWAVLWLLGAILPLQAVEALDLINQTRPKIWSGEFTRQSGYGDPEVSAHLDPLMPYYAIVGLGFREDDGDITTMRVAYAEMRSDNTLGAVISHRYGSDPYHSLEQDLTADPGYVLVGFGLSARDGNISQLILYTRKLGPDGLTGPTVIKKANASVQAEQQVLEEQMVMIGVEAAAKGNNIRLASATFTHLEKGVAPDYGNWMGRLASVIGGKKLWEVSIPGTHDSGTYGIDLQSDLVNPVMQGIASVGGPSEDLLRYFVGVQSRAQNLTWAEQLRAGVRYFDVRVAFDQGRFRVYHGALGMYSHDDLNVLFNDLTAFLAESPQEIVILDFQNFANFSQDQHLALVRLLGQKLSGKLVTGLARAQTSSMRNLWSQGKQVVVLYELDQPQLDNYIKLAALPDGKEAILARDGCTIVSTGPIRTTFTNWAPS